MGMKAIIIEDDKSIVEAVNLALRFRWSDAELISSTTGKEGIQLVRDESPDVVVLDINLPDISGFNVLKKIREYSSVPIVILTVRSDDADVMKGLEMGADDYVIKPFNILTLLARINAVMRRTGRDSLKEDSTVISTRLKIDFVNQKVIIDNRLVKLTPAEYRLLVLLVKSKGKIVSYKRIIREVWEKDFSGQTEIVRICVQRLRKKLLDTPPTMILNKPGAGYMFKG
jgi:DNA-binding response OmpR family regulator